jgi:hypothetical protein
MMNFFPKYLEVLMALILYVQGIRNTRLEENLLEEDKDMIRELMKSCVLDNVCVTCFIPWGKLFKRY